MNYLTVEKLRRRLQDLEEQGEGERPVTISTWGRHGETVETERVFDVSVLDGELRLETM